MREIDFADLSNRLGISFLPCGEQEPYHKDTFLMLLKRGGNWREEKSPRLLRGAFPANFFGKCRFFGAILKRTPFFRNTEWEEIPSGKGG